MNDGGRYVIWGSAGHAKVLADAVGMLRGQVVALFDNDAAATPALDGIPLFIGGAGFAKWRESDPSEVFGLVAIGGSRGRDRIRIQTFFQGNGVRVKPIIHPNASVSLATRIGAGSQILSQALVASAADIGDACIVNHKANVDHECKLGDGSHVAPGATLCGCVTLGANVLVGAGAVLLPRVTVGADTIVGAGAVVTRDLPAGVIAFGNPATIRRTVAPDEVAGVKTQLAVGH